MLQWFKSRSSKKKLYLEMSLSSKIIDSTDETRESSKNKNEGREILKLEEYKFVFLGIAMLYVEYKNKNFCRAILDLCYQINIISQSLVRKHITINLQYLMKNFTMAW